MRRLLLHLAVALLAFIIGVATATAFAGLLGARVSSERGKRFHAPRTHKSYSCPSRTRFVREVPEEKPVQEKRMRVVIRKSDGTTHMQFVESENVEKTVREF